MNGDARRKDHPKAVFVNGRSIPPPDPDVKAVVDRVMDPDRTLPIKKEVTRYGH
jgi:hypothetical protein